MDQISNHASYKVYGNQYYVNDGDSEYNNDINITFIPFVSEY